MDRVAMRGDKLRSLDTTDGNGPANQSLCWHLSSWLTLTIEIFRAPFWFWQNVDDDVQLRRQPPTVDETKDRTIWNDLQS